MKHVAFALVLLALAATGCGGPSYERTDISDVSTGDLPSSISLQSISMPVGAATKAIIRPYNDDGEIMSGSVTSENPQLLEIAPGILEHEYIFMARTVGSTTVRFAAGSSIVAIASVQVTAQ